MSRLLDLEVLQAEHALDRGCAAGFVSHEVHPGGEPDSVGLMPGFHVLARLLAIAVLDRERVLRGEGSCHSRPSRQSAGP